MVSGEQGFVGSCGSFVPARRAARHAAAQSQARSADVKGLILFDKRDDGQALASNGIIISGVNITRTS